jgi:UDP-galactopyranose mutase
MTRRNVTVVGAGLAGCVAAALLKDRHDVTVRERGRRPGGLCKDNDGRQECGPHAFHTDDAEVEAFVKRFAEWKPFALRVHVQTDPELRELPIRAEDDAAFRVYSAKAWGREFRDLPPEIRARVPAQCLDGREGYHAGRFKAQPVGGYVKLCERLLDGVAVLYGDPAHADPGQRPAGPVIWTGDINDAWRKDELPWISRHWCVARDAKLAIPGHVVNHATFAVPQLRSYDARTINPWARGHGIGCEFIAGPGAGRPCYPMPGREAEAARRVAALRLADVWCCGRMGAYKYLDMDQTVRNVMDTIKETGL